MALNGTKNVSYFFFLVSSLKHFGYFAIVPNEKKIIEVYLFLMQ